ncbi:hypothetical protein KN1_10630 [Stygiolobus caldivivus]|uniref:Uncharacterized protein n=2 Tax=Stygiolobus caldivivus TaxID=2824673 RepID=A0A8D5ZIM6_9CREN|nr:hypothetical protein KN1_10630 [Stygiolobus caldivivus]
MDEERCEKAASELAKVARVVVNYDRSYDIIDELNRAADDPKKVLELLTNLSRVVLKVYKKVEEGGGEGLRDVLAQIRKWDQYLEVFEKDCLNGPKYVRVFTSLSIVPDDNAFRVIRALEGSGPEA